MARVQVIEQVEEDFREPDGWVLWLQWCLYVFDNGESKNGYRFIWRRPQSEGGSLQAARGQARIPSLKVAKDLIDKAVAAGWGSFNADKEVCPECGHHFMGNGFDGIDAHWRAKHEHIMPYEKAWPLIKSGTYQRK
jgi:hypothetical protein